MKRLEVEELVLGLANKEINYKRLDGMSSTLLDRYEIENSVILSIAFYSNMIAFGFLEGKEAGELAKGLIENYSSYELKEKAITLFGEDLTNFYKESVELDYSLVSGPLYKILNEMGNDLESTIEDFIDANEKLEGILPKEIQ